MEINVNIAGEHLNSKLAAKQLHLIADMVRAGVTELDAFNIEYMGAVSVAVDFESDGPLPHADFRDGEGNHIHVNEEGFVVFRLAPGAEEPEPLLDKNITVADWSKEHGGITPFVPEDPHAGHNH